MAGPLAGRWTSCQLPEGFNPVHASVLPDGTVLLMAGSGNYTPDFEAGRFQSYIFAPDTCAATRLPTPGDLFCAGHAGLPNGNVLIAGGTRQYDPFQGLRTSYEYNWVTKQFVRLPLMAGGGRWYPGPPSSATVTCSCSPASTAPARSTPSPRSTATAVAPGAPRPIG